MTIQDKPMWVRLLLSCLGFAMMTISVYGPDLYRYWKKKHSREAPTPGGYEKFLPTSTPKGISQFSLDTDRRLHHLEGDFSIDQKLAPTWVQTLTPLKEKVSHPKGFHQRDCYEFKEGERKWLFWVSAAGRVRFRLTK